MTNSKLAAVSFAYEFPMGHRLQNHAGRCRHLHGHNYSVTVKYYGIVNEDGFVIDFSKLKAAVRGVLDPFDHAFVIECNDPCRDAIMPFGVIFTMQVPPSAENLGRWWKDLLIQELKCSEISLELEVRETRDCVAWI